MKYFDNDNASGRTTKGVAHNFDDMGLPSPRVGKHPPEGHSEVNRDVEPAERGASRSKQIC